eukprot:6458623-Amphidinium_carterae.1
MHLVLAAHQVVWRIERNMTLGDVEKDSATPMLDRRSAKAMSDPRDWVWVRHQWPTHFPTMSEAFPENSIKNLRWAQSRTI